MNLKTWGETWNEDLLRSRDNRCPTCGNGTLGHTDFYENCKKLIVGLQPGGFKTVAIFRCPKCQNLFWFHLDSVFAKWLCEDMKE